ncbi:MAG: hypothetical protein BYD32DRAFT_490023, partial [Podila humilis]
ETTRVGDPQTQQQPAIKAERNQDHLHPEHQQQTTTSHAFLQVLQVLQEPDRLGRHLPCSDPSFVHGSARQAPPDDQRRGSREVDEHHHGWRRLWPLQPLNHQTIQPAPGHSGSAPRHTCILYLS